jgi:acetolactate synthase-1/2/3 large subunit
MKAENMAGRQKQRITGAQAVISCLEAEGVEYVFGYPGGQAIKLFDALYDSEIRFVLARHEQGAVHEADGYARSTGRAGVVLVTSGPGATNTVTGIATAYMDSVPLVVITGQVPLSVIGTDSFQESDIFGITLPVVKHSYLLRDVRDLTETFREAFHIAQTGRPGPVLIDVPSDVAGELLDFHYPETVNLPSYKPTIKGNQKQIRQAARAIAHAQRPLIIAGGGVVTAEASDEMEALIDLMQIPAVTTLLGKGCIPTGDLLNLGPVGMHGSKFANEAVAQADLLIAVGTHLSDRVTGKVEKFAVDARLVHIDIDPAEIGKIRVADVPIVGDAKGVLADIVEALRKQDAQPQTAAWKERIAQWRARWPIGDPAMGQGQTMLVPERVMTELSDRLDPLASIVTTEVGQHQMWAAQYIARTKPRTFISSGGLGTMGFGFPAAIGAKLAHPECQTVCVAGDGSFQMNVQEMATAKAQGVAVKVLIMDNECLGMVHQWQSLFYGGRYAATELTGNPDFVQLAHAYGWQGRRVENAEDLGAALDEMLACEGPYLLDVRIPREENVYPMVPPGGAMEDMMGAIDLAVGAVRIGVEGRDPHAVGGGKGGRR